MLSPGAAVSNRSKLTKSEMSAKRFCSALWCALMPYLRRLYHYLSFGAPCLGCPRHGAPLRHLDFDARHALAPALPLDHWQVDTQAGRLHIFVHKGCCGRRTCDRYRQTLHQRPLRCCCLQFDAAAFHCVGGQPCNASGQHDLRRGDTSSDVDSQPGCAADRRCPTERLQCLANIGDAHGGSLRVCCPPS